MIVQCQQCRTKFRLDDGRVTEAGVKVRCSKCRHVFVVRREVPEEETFVEEAVTSSAVAPAVRQEPHSASGAGAADFEFDGIEEPPPGIGGPGGFHLAEAPEEDEAKHSFEVNYPPPREDDFDFSDFELKLDEDKPVADGESIPGEPFDFGVFSQPDQQDNHDFDIMPAREERSLGLTLSSAEETSDDQQKQSPSTDEAGATAGPVIDFGDVLPEEKAEVAGIISSADLEVPGREKESAPQDSEDELPPFVVSRRQGSSFFPVAVTAVAVIFVLIIAGAGVYFLKAGPEGFERIGLGFVTKWFGIEPKEEGRIALRGVDASFVKNAEAGEVFVIRGEAVNDYKKARASIQVKGVVFGKNGSEILNKTIYCGNSISNELISALPMSKIESTMNNQFGDSLSNLGVPPGKSIPFVIVLANVPRDASDYAVEVAGSTVASQ